MADLAVALDLPDGASALRVADRLAGTVGWFKVGGTLYAAEGPGVVRELTARGARVFLDLKWHDIPSAVAGAVTASALLGVSLATVHLSGGRAMLEAAARAASGRLSLVGVGVLTSMDASDYAEVVGRPVDDIGAELERLARLGMAAGLDGAVCSTREAARLRASLGERALLVVPGIRRAGEGAGDQVRTATPAEAVAAGADLLVVGRPVTGVADPRGAALAVLEEMRR